MAGRASGAELPWLVHYTCGNPAVQTVGGGTEGGRQRGLGHGMKAGREVWDVGWREGEEGRDMG